MQPFSTKSDADWLRKRRTCFAVFLPQGRAGHCATVGNSRSTAAAREGEVCYVKQLLVRAELVMAASHARA
jgi:hypothetical protein